jgi:hypothetical protein
VYYEIFDSMEKAISREKQLKAGSRKQKILLISEFNPDWKDLSETIKKDGGGSAPPSLVSQKKYYLNSRTHTF